MLAWSKREIASGSLARNWPNSDSNKFSCRDLNEGLKKRTIVLRRSGFLCLSLNRRSFAVISRQWKKTYVRKSCTVDSTLQMITLPWNISTFGTCIYTGKDGHQNFIIVHQRLWPWRALQTDNILGFREFNTCIGKVIALSTRFNFCTRIAIPICRVGCIVVQIERLMKNRFVVNKLFG